MDDNIDKPLHLVLREDGKAIEREIIDSSGVHHIIIVDDPSKQYVLSNGAVFDPQRKIIKGPPGGGVNGITKSTYPEARQARYEAAERAARKAIISKSKDKTIMGGWQTIIAAQFALAKEGNAYSTNAAKFVGKAAGLLRGDGEQAPQAANSGQSVISDELARALVAAIELKREQERGK